MTIPYPDYGCLYKCYSIVAQNGGIVYTEVAERIPCLGMYSFRHVE